MITTFKEYNSTFAIDFKAETIEDANLITRFGLNSISLGKGNYTNSSASRDGEFRLYISIAKTKDNHTTISRK